MGLYLYMCLLLQLCYGNAVKRYWVLWYKISYCIIIHSWPVMHVYFNATQHSYSNLKIYKVDLISFSRFALHLAVLFSLSMQSCVMNLIFLLQSVT
jgi:hypothetical protein